MFARFLEFSGVPSNLITIVGLSRSKPVGGRKAGRGGVMKTRRWYRSGRLAFVALGGMAVLVGMVAFPPGASATIVYQFPPAGTDVLGLVAQLTAQPGACGTGGQKFTIPMTGPLTVQRSNPMSTPSGMAIQTRILQLDLKGHSSQLGNVEVKLNPTRASRGTVDSDGATANFPARSFFDIFTEISLGGSNPLTNATAMHMSVDGLRFLPPVGSHYMLTNGPVQLMDATGRPVACATNATATPYLPPDHQLCYAATSTAFKAPTNVVLRNQFIPSGFPITVTAPLMHCNPVQKTVTSTTPPTIFPINNPAAHLLCFVIKPVTPVPPHTVSVTNQFGRNVVMTTNQPNVLCLPSWKSLTGPVVNPPSIQPPGLDHFTCYPVTVIRGQFSPPPVSLADEFVPAGTPPVPVRVGAPTSLCLPTTKVVAGATFPSIDPIDHFLCFRITPATPRRSPVFDFNQFGQGPVTIKPATAATSNEQLCLPSTKVLLR
jgi:hypothetical protein